MVLGSKIKINYLEKTQQVHMHPMSRRCLHEGPKIQSKTHKQLLRPFTSHENISEVLLSVTLLLFW